MWRPLRLALPSRWATCCLAMMFAAALADASTAKDADTVNRIIDGKSAAGRTGQPSSAPIAAPPSGAGTEKERWIKYLKPIDNLNIIVGRSTAGVTCKDVIFKLAKAISEKIEINGKTEISIPLGPVCWLQLRNASEDRALLVRFSEAFKRAALETSPQVFYGRQLAPYEIVTFALRPISDPLLPVKLEVIWDDAREANAQADFITLNFLTTKMVATD